MLTTRLTSASDSNSRTRHFSSRPVGAEKRSRAGLTIFARFFLIGALILVPNAGTAEQIFLTPRDFLAETFEGKIPKPQVLWIKGELKASITDILGRKSVGLRIRYWGRGSRTAWILEEIGKYMPITAAFVVERGQIRRVSVLVYRESIGWEIRYPFFTDQFSGISLSADRRLSRTPDNISGATLSTEAMARMGKLALYLHQQTPHAND
jgi:hypothetical protein